MAEARKCGACGNELPADAPWSKKYCDEKCKKTQNTRRYRAKKNGSAAKILEEITKVGQAPHLVEITEQLVRKFGGVEPFVKQMYEQFQASPPAHKGSWWRVFMKLIETTTELGGADRDLGTMNDADLRREAQRILDGE